MSSIDIFPWNENLNTGVAIIDAQHKKLVQLLNQLASYVAVQPDISTLNVIFDELAEYAVYHFQSEEAIWHEHLSADPMEAQHKEIHGSFITTVVKLKGELNTRQASKTIEELLSFLTNWLASHILDTDRYMALVVLAMQAGLSLEAAKIDAQEKMCSTRQALLDLLLSTYGYHVTNTLRLMHEIDEHKLTVNKLKDAQQAQAENIARIEALTNSALDAIISMDQDGKVIAWNPQAEVIYGYTQAQAMGREVAELIIPSEYREAHRQGLALFIRTGSTSKMGKRIETRGMRSNGTEFPMEIALSALVLNKKYVFSAYVRDITELKQKEKEALDMREQIIQATKMESIGHLTAGIAHDFNNILAAMMGFGELTRHMLAKGKVDAIDHYQSELLKAGKRAKELILQMLTFSRISPENTTAEAPVTQLTTIIKEVVSLLRSSIPSTILLNYSIESPDIQAHILPVHLHQILLNLGVNARDAMGEYGMINISLTRQHHENKICSSCKMKFAGNYAQITVKDSGSGIPEHILNKIFDPFYTTKGVGKGTGMGLSVVHGLVHAQHGHIYVETSAADGTAFNILLPLSASEEDAKISSEQTQAANLKGARIMVVDDESLISTFLLEYLSEYGAHVLAFNDSNLALQAYTQNPGNIDLVITDETMPDMSGMLLAEKILKITPGLPIILCTGYSAHATQKTASEIGIAGFFHKPLNMNELMLKIQTLLKINS